MVSPSTKKAAVYGMNSDIPLTCPRPLGGREHLTLARGDSTMRSFVICFEDNMGDNMGVTWGRSFCIRPHVFLLGCMNYPRRYFYLRGNVRPFIPNNSQNQQGKNRGTDTKGPSPVHLDKRTVPRSSGSKRLVTP